MSEWFGDLGATLDMVWARLAAGVADDSAAARYPAFASVGTNGGAEARLVRLRVADRRQAQVVFHTDLLSAKVGELASNGQAALLVWEPELKFQIRLRVQAAVQSGAQVAHLWADIPPGSRRAYGGMPPPGQPIEAPESHDRAIDPARLAVVECAVQSIDTVNLTEPRHHRALFERANGFSGQWLAP